MAGGSPGVDLPDTYTPRPTILCGKGGPIVSEYRPGIRFTNTCRLGIDNKYTLNDIGIDNRISRTWYTVCGLGVHTRRVVVQ